MGEACVASRDEWAYLYVEYSRLGLTIQSKIWHKYRVRAKRHDGIVERCRKTIQTSWEGKEPSRL